MVESIGLMSSDAFFFGSTYWTVYIYFGNISYEDFAMADLVFASRASFMHILLYIDLIGQFLSEIAN